MAYGGHIVFWCIIMVATLVALDGLFGGGRRCP